jgi:hypothetical protein
MGKGGGGSPAPQQTTATQYSTNIPEYAKPYVMNMLNAAQAQVYNPDMTGFREYKPYSANPQDYFAGPSSLQQSTYNEASGMQTPGQFNLATGLGGIAGMGQLGAGQQYARQATDPRAIQQYMSPFMQNVVDTQKMAAVRDFQVAQPVRQAAATRAGAFGGSRSAIENAEAQRNLMSQLQGIQATGTQNAFDKAQQAQQFGANLGLQGMQGAAQTAGMLGQLGGAQQQADIARLGLQNQLGGQQQQYQQGIINQAIQDYATQQQYPMIQLANMSNLLRGLPMQSGTTQMYQAAPNQLSQLGGLAATGLGVYGASGGFRAAKGGEVKSYAEGGEVASYAPGGVVGGIEAQLMQMDIPQLQQVAKTSPSVSIREKAAEIIAQKQMAMQTKQAMGIDTLPAGNLDDIGMASGGIVAFENGGEVPRFNTGAIVVDPRGVARASNYPLALYEEPKKIPKASILRNLARRSGYGMAALTGADLLQGLVDSDTGTASEFQDDLTAMQGTHGGYERKQKPLSVYQQMQKDENQRFAKENPSPAVVPPVVDNGKGAGGASGSGAPAVPPSGGGGAGGKYEKEIEAGLAELKKGLSGGMAQKDLDALRENIKENQDQKFWMSLIQGGAKAMQSTSPHAMVGLGAGIEEGAKTYGKGMEAERADKKLLIAQQAALEQVEYARKSGNLNALIQAQGRLDTIQAQRENLGTYRQSQLDAQRMKVGSDAYMKALAAGKTDEEAMASAQQSLGVFERYNSKQPLPADQQALNWLKTAKAGVNGVTQKQIDGIKARLQAKGLV